MRTREMHMGALAVLLCVTVLCVAVFGALTLVTAAGDLRMARRTGEYTRSWDHTAVWQPEETLHLWPGEGAEDGN